MRTSTIYILGLAGFLVLNTILFHFFGWDDFTGMLLAEGIFGLIPVLFIAGILYHPYFFNIPGKIAFGWTFLAANWAAIILVLYFSIRGGRLHDNHKPNISDYSNIYINQKDTNFLAEKIIDHLIQNQNGYLVINSISTIDLDPNGRLEVIQLYHGNTDKKPLYSFWIGNKNTLEFSLIDSTQFMAYKQLKDINNYLIDEFVKRNKEHFREKWFSDSIVSLTKSSEK